MYKPDCGIYCLKNTVTGECYIGKAKELPERKRAHFSSLKRGNHQVAALQKSYDQHGEGAFSFEVLERTDTQYNGDRELHWIRTLLPAFNTAGIRPIARKPYPPRKQDRTSSEPPDRFVKAIKEEMVAMGISAYGLVKLLRGKRDGGKDVPPATVYQFLRGDSGINSTDRESAALWLDITIQSII